MSTALPLLANISYRVGESLVFNGCKEKFVGNSKADKLLKRRGRGKYKIPNKV